MPHTSTSDATQDPQHRAAVPLAAKWLGATGALPFLALMILIVLGTPAWTGWATQALAFYGALILSFLGGVQWGLAIGAGKPVSDSVLARRLAISVLPSLIGWAALLMPLQLALLLMAASFALVLSFDLQASAKGDAPVWYPKLRVPLSVVVITTLLVGALA